MIQRILDAFMQICSRIMLFCIGMIALSGFVLATQQPGFDLRNPSIFMPVLLLTGILLTVWVIITTISKLAIRL